MTPAVRVVVLGDVVVDVVARLSGPPEPGSDRAAAITLHGGGAGANVATWLAAAGAEAHLVARVGDDEAGRAQVADLRAAGVTLHVVVDRERPTGTIVVLVSPDGERTMLPDRGANLGLAPADVPDALLQRGTHLHVSGYALLDAGPRPAARHALAVARARGASTSVDTSSVGPLREVGPERFRAWTRGVDLCRANAAEATLLVGRADPHAAAQALLADYDEVVVTLGAEGAVHAGPAGTTAAPAAATRVRDTTGAGDAFTAGYLAASLAGAAPREALASGARLAARAVAGSGARPARRLALPAPQDRPAPPAPQDRPAPPDAHDRPGPEPRPSPTAPP